MDSSLHEIELQILQLVALIVGGLVVLALKRAAAWIGLKLKADQVAMLNSAVDKAMTFGVTKADAVIRDKGWDHVDSKNQVIDYAFNTIESKFADALRANKIDLSQTSDRQRLMQMMERMWPDVAARLSASPATPPAPVVPLVMAAPAAGS